MNYFSESLMQTRESSPDADELRNECRIFTRYLLRQEPDSYVLKCYVSLQPAALEGTSPLALADAVLLETGKSGLFRLRIADAYARIFRPHCLLRRKLILTFAILENSGRFHTRFTSGISASYPSALIRIAASVIGFGLALTASLFVVAPRILLGARRSKRSRA
jgi:hypothetical protein